MFICICNNYLLARTYICMCVYASSICFAIFSVYQMQKSRSFTYICTWFCFDIFFFTPVCALYLFLLSLFLFTLLHCLLFPVPAPPLISVFHRKDNKMTTFRFLSLKGLMSDQQLLLS